MVAKIYAAETPVLEMGRILKNKLSPLRVKGHFIFCIRMMAYGCVKAKWCVRAMWECFQARGCGFFHCNYRIIYFAYLLKVNDIHSH